MDCLECKGWREIGVPKKEGGAQEVEVARKEEREKQPKQQFQLVVSDMNTFTLDRLNDIVDYETEHILKDRVNRYEHYETLDVSIKCWSFGQYWW